METPMRIAIQNIRCKPVFIVYKFNVQNKDTNF
jgi:hypothetical protein